MVTQDIPRDYDSLDVSKHAGQQSRDRNIGSYEVKEAIEKGEVEEGAKEQDIVYRNKFPGPDLLVVVDPERMLITTVFWDDDQGATGGAI